MSAKGSSSITFGILTVSDSCSQGKAEDKSGPNLINLITKGLIAGGEVIVHHCVPDEEEDIKEVLEEWADIKHVDVILTTGGTGFSCRDVTPEVTKKVIQRETPGLTIAMFNKSLAITPFAMLSRAASGIRDSTLIINLPGSTKGAQECLEIVATAIPHAVALMKDRTAEVMATHKIVQSNVASLQTCGGHHHRHHHHHHHDHHHHHHSDSKVDTSRVARRARESPYPLLDVDTAQKIVLENTEVLGTETVKFTEALGRVLAEDVVAKDPLPPFPASIKDGYAVLASDGAGKRKVLGSAIAGVNPGEQEKLQAGYCLRINTGAPVPAGADCVVQVEDTKLIQEADDGKIEVEIEILIPPKVGQDIRPVGSDMAQGELVLPRGSTLGSSELGLLATAGVTHIQVYKLPIVSILSTGNEIQDPSKPLEPGRIRDSNKTTLMSLMKEHGFPAVDVGIARDDQESVLSKLKEALAASDLVVTTGGVSMGEKDLLKEILVTDLGAVIHFGRVKMKPGKPTTFATCMFNGKKKLVLGLPGNPVSATVTSHLYVLPSLRKMSGYASPLGTIIKATTDVDISLDPRPEYHRAALTWLPDNPVPKAISTGNQISSRLLSFSSAKCLLILPGRTEKLQVLPAGTLVNALVVARL